MKSNSSKILATLLLFIAFSTVTLTVFPESNAARFLRIFFPNIEELRNEDQRQADAKSRGMRLLYQFVDENNNIQIVETLADVPPEKRADVGFFEVPLSASETSEKEQSVSGPLQIIVYTTSWCGYCARLRDDLNQAEIPFEERDIEKSDAAREAYDKLGLRGVPITVIGDNIFRGYQPQNIKQFYQDHQ